MRHSTPDKSACQFGVSKRRIPDLNHNPPLSGNHPTHTRLRVKRESCQWRGCRRKAAERPGGSRYCREHEQQAFLSEAMRTLPPRRSRMLARLYGGYTSSRLLQ